MSIEPGTYQVTLWNYAGGPPGVGRDVGLGPDSHLVVHPEGVKGEKWTVQQASSGDIYVISISGNFLRPDGDRVIAPPIRAPPFEWRILRGAPSPPPVGNQSFAIFVPDARPQESLTPESNLDNPDEFYIKIGDVGYPFWFQRVDND